jgi:branched-chain amino acid transport system ATP-binding protein
MLIVKSLDAFYGRAQVLFGLDLQVARGEAVALMGRNGAGKSTALKCLVGLVPHTAGEMTLCGRDISRLDPFRIARLGLGYVAEERRIFTDLTVAENLEAGRRPPRQDAPAWTAERLFEMFPNLAEIRRRRAAHISGGEQQMLAIARTLMGNPAILLLDEPSEGLAPKILDVIAATVSALKSEGLTILLAEQSLRFAGAIAERVAVIETGHIRWQGPMADFAADAEAQARYLLA